MVAPSLSKRRWQVALTAACLWFADAHAACPPPESLSPSFDIASVTDGDTFRLTNGQRVRIVGINAFELRSSGWQGRYAEAARDRATELLSSTVRLSPWPAPTDRYGRLLANVWLGERYLAEHLVEEGLALAIAVPPNVRLAECLLDQEVEATAALQGVWALKQLPAALSKIESLGGFQDLVGEVTSVTIRGRSTVVTLDGRLRVEWLSNLGVPTLHQQVRVRGWVSKSPPSYRAEFPWTLRVLHPVNVQVPFRITAAER